MNIGKYEVKLKDKLGWYDLEEIKNEMVSGAKLDNSGIKGFNGEAMLKSKMKLWELAIQEIKDGEKVIPFSLFWAKELSQSEGNALDTAVEELSKKK